MPDWLRIAIRDSDGTETSTVDCATPITQQNFFLLFFVSFLLAFYFSDSASNRPQNDTADGNKTYTFWACLNPLFVDVVDIGTS